MLGHIEILGFYPSKKKMKNLGCRSGCVTLPYKGRTNQIIVDGETHMKHMVIELEGKNAPISFAHNLLGSCFLEDNHGFYITQPYSIHADE